MKTADVDWRSLLRSALDPGAGAAEAETLPLEDIFAMRRTVVEAARERSGEARRSRSLALVATVIVLTGVGAVIGRQFERRGPAASRPTAGTLGSGGEQLQLQFATPGGTRIIWVFNADLELKAATR